MWLSAAVQVAAWTVVLGQSAVPSNSTIPSYLGTNSSLELDMYTQGQSKIANPIYALLAGEPETHLPTIQALAEISPVGNLKNVNTSNYNDLAQGDFALISCDPRDYISGNIGFSAVINGVTAKIDAPPHGTPYRNTGGAIILYSMTSAWCNFTPSDPNEYRSVFTLTSADAADMIRSVIFDSGGQAPRSYIQVNQTSRSLDTDPSNGQVSADGPTPTTTIAMVILYVITGLITLLFLVIIISGAYRAHRHPERYRGRMLMGRPVEGSRARGIAAALLDTIPIVKFGERDQSKPGDIEMQNSTQSGSSRQVTPGETTPETRNIASMSTDANAQSSTPTDTPAAAPSEDPAQAAEAGLACSVCTDDFVKGQDTRVLPCNHKFHPECIDPWLLNVSGTCPLCRIELNPPNSDAEATDSNSQRESSDGERHRTRDRRSAGLSTIIHRALNRQHMSSASPEQRLEALRDLRRQNTRDAASAGEEDERMRNRVGNRLSRLLGRGREADHDGGERQGDGIRHGESQVNGDSQTNGSSSTPTGRST